MDAILTTKWMSHSIIGMQWAEAIPAGIIVINNCGEVDYYNQYAQDVLGAAIQPNRQWSKVLEQLVAGTTHNGFYVALKTNRKLLLKTQSLPHVKGQIVLLIDETEHFKQQISHANLEKIDVIGKLSASLAHQLRTPLAAALLYTSLIGNSSRDEKNSEYKQKIINQLKNIQQQIDNVLLINRGDQVRPECINLKIELYNIIETYEDIAKNTKILIEVSRSKHDYPILGEPQAIRGAISNIIENAIQAVSVRDKPIIKVMLYTQEHHAVIECIDNGIGISSYMLKQVNKPFFSSKAEGNGLGLAIANQVVNEHLGQMTITSKENEYTRVIIKLPLHFQRVVIEDVQYEN